MNTSRFNLRNVVAAAICLAAMTMFVSCEKPDTQQVSNITFTKCDDGVNNKLIGKWVTANNNSRHNDTIHFTADMRVEDYFMFVHTTMYPASSYYFTYSLIGNKIEITNHQPENVKFGEIFEYILNGKSLTIKGFSNPFSLTNEARTDVHFTKVE